MRRHEEEQGARRDCLREQPRLLQHCVGTEAETWRVALGGLVGPSGWTGMNRRQIVGRSAVVLGSESLDGR